MCSSETKPSAIFTKRVYWTVVPFLGIAMFFTTAVAGIPSILLYKNTVGPEHFDLVIFHYGLIVLATVTLEGIFFFAGIYIIWRLMRRVTSLTDEMQMLTRSILHDISTPISHIQHQVDRLLEPEPDVVEIRSKITSSCTHLLKVLRLSSEISKTYEGLDRSGAEPVNFTSLVRDTCEIYDPAAEDKGIKLICETPAERISLTAHTYRLQRLVSNLVDNALKFTPSGGRITVSLEKRDSKIILKVSDTGIGMTADEKALAFQRFYRAEKSRTTPGHGLGLSLVDAIVKFYRGKITVKSAPNAGTTFTISLPV